jgi:hypothetical protein
MRFCILIFLFSGWALAQSPTQGTWSADNDNPPGLEEARAKNYEKNLRPPEKHPPAYYTADYYEYQVDRKVTFTSYPVGTSSEKSEAEAKEEPKTKERKYYAGGGYIQGRRISAKNCTYTCNKKVPATRPKRNSNKRRANGRAKTYAKTNKIKSRKPTNKKHYVPIITKRKHTKKPSISRKQEGSSLR